MAANPASCEGGGGLVEGMGVGEWVARQRSQERQITSKSNEQQLNKLLNTTKSLEKALQPAVA